MLGPWLLFVFGYDLPSRSHPGWNAFAAMSDVASTASLLLNLIVFTLGAELPFGRPLFLAGSAGAASLESAIVMLTGQQKSRTKMLKPKLLQNIQSKAKAGSAGGSSATCVVDAAGERHIKQQAGAA